MYDAELFRTKVEVAAWKQRDPVTLFDQSLRTWGYLDDADLAKMESAIAAEVDEAVAFAEVSPWEPIEDLTKDVYSPAVSDQQSAISQELKADC